MQRLGPNPVIEATQKVLPIEMQIQVMSIYATHGVKKDETGRLAMYPTLRKFRHSCTPNTNYGWDSNLDSVILHTIKPVHQGEEIVYSFVTPLKTLEKRVADLEAIFEVRCPCPAGAGASTVQEKRIRRCRQYICDLFERLQS